MRRQLGKIFSFIYSRQCDYPVMDNVTNMRLMTKKCRSYFLQFNERPFIGGMTIWTGAKIGTVKILWKNQKRKSQYSFIKLLEHGRLGLIVFSSKILKIFSLFGFLASLAACIYLIFLAYIFIEKGVSVPGFFTLAGIMGLFFGSAVAGRPKEKSAGDSQDSWFRSLDCPFQLCARRWCGCFPRRRLSFCPQCFGASACRGDSKGGSLIW
jgi:hypothetical protein